MTPYEEVHPRHRLGNRQVRQRFPRKLAQWIPVGCKPILLTDAGFRSPWFDAVERWRGSWIGRIRNRDRIRMAGGPWQAAKDGYALAAGEAREIIDVLPARSPPTHRRLFLLKKPPKGRAQRTRFGARRRSKRA